MLGEHIFLALLLRAGMGLRPHTPWRGGREEGFTAEIALHDLSHHPWEWDQPFHAPALPSRHDEGNEQVTKRYDDVCYLLHTVWKYEKQYYLLFMGTCILKNHEKLNSGIWLGQVRTEEEQEVCLRTSAIVIKV